MDNYKKYNKEDGNSVDYMHQGKQEIIRIIILISVICTTIALITMLACMNFCNKKNHHHGHHNQTTHIATNSVVSNR